MINPLKIPGSPTSKDEEWDDASTTIYHKKVIESKPFLKKVYLEWYKIFQENIQDLPDGLKIEIGSGGGFLKDIIKDVVTSDVVDLPGVEQVFFAEKMPYPNESVSAVILLNTLHHIKKPDDFFLEVNRCLKQNGRLIMIEPTNSRLGRFVYKNFHFEPFDEKQSDWQIKGDGRLTNANQALPWIIFVRDKEKFQRKYPNLEIFHVSKHTPFNYWLSGGVSLKQLVPSASYPLFRKIEKLLAPLNNHIGSFMTIVLQKH